MSCLQLSGGIKAIPEFLVGGTSGAAVILEVRVRHCFYIGHANLERMRAFEVI
jgi:hypothetical protein